MKKTNRILALGAALLFSANAMTAGAAEANLLENGDFSQLEADGAPKGWKLNENVTLGNENGKNFLRITANEPDKHILSYRRLYLPKPAPKALEIKIKARANAIERGKKNWLVGTFVTQFKDAKDKMLKPKPPAPKFAGTTDWVEKNFYVSVPEGALYLELMPYMMQAKSGSLDIAGIEVLPTDPANVPPPPPPPPPKKFIPSETLTPKDLSGMPPALKVVGNKIMTDDGKEVWLQGLSLDSMQWNGGGENILKSIPVAMDQWKANAIRLPITDEFWSGRNKWQNDNGAKYRKLVDDAIAAVAARGGYLIIDLHRFHAPTAVHVEFWKDVATRYKNHPAVIFELFNEPHSLSWQVWQDGGNLKGKENKSNDQGAVESKEKADSDYCVGMQKLLDTVRETGANNPVIVGGLDWGYDLSGISSGKYGLTEREGGRGIIYSTHVYPWKKDWQKRFLDMADKYPLFVGELGNIRAWEDFKFIPESMRREEVGVNSRWPHDMLGLIQKYKLNWTGFSFHPKCGPQILKDWDYNPTDFWGVHVKDALSGKQFKLEKLR